MHKTIGHCGYIYISKIKYTNFAIQRTNRKPSTRRDKTTISIIQTQATETLVV